MKLLAYGAVFAVAILVASCAEQPTQDDGAVVAPAPNTDDQRILRLSLLEDKVKLLLEFQQRTDARRETPIGTVLPYFGPIRNGLDADLVKSGWLPCDGAEVDPQEYEELHALLSSVDKTLPPESKLSRAGKLFTPDLRRQFLRGAYGSDSLLVGLRQDDQVGKHMHWLFTNYQQDVNQAKRVGPTDFVAHRTIGADPISYRMIRHNRVEQPDKHPGVGLSSTPVIDVGDGPTKLDYTTESGLEVRETRPRNVAVNFIIKAR